LPWCSFVVGISGEGSGECSEGGGVDWSGGESGIKGMAGNLDLTMALQPHSSGVKIQDPMLDHQR
nr:hypothetical protein [Tanacetum cinerariifolium]